MAEYRSRSKKPQTTPEQAFVEGVAGFFGAIFKALFGGGTKKGGLSAAAAAELASHWDSVHFHYSTGTHALAVSEADKLLDAAMRATGFPGSNMGERLQSAKDRLGSELYQKVWDAHKLRNRLAHEIGSSASEAEAGAALTTFKTALRQLGVPL